MLEAIDAGVTTVLDFCHAVVHPRPRRRRHRRDARVRHPQPVRRRVLRHARSAAELLTRRRAARPHHPTPQGPPATPTTRSSPSESRSPTCPRSASSASAQELAGVRALGLRSTTNGLAILFHDPVDDLAVFEEAGLHGPDIVWVHLNYASHEQLQRLFDRGGHVAICTEAEMAMGMGRPVTERALAAGGHCTFGCDVTTSVSGSILNQARTAMQVGRLFAADEGMQQGRAPASVTPTSETMLRAATAWGAEALAMDDRIGTLRAGKQADITIIRATDVNTAPINDPYATVITQAHPGNVDTVMVAGKVLKRDGKLVADWASVRSRLEESHAYVTAQVEAAGGFRPAARDRAAVVSAGAHHPRRAGALPTTRPATSDVTARRLHGPENGGPAGYWVGHSVYPPGARAELAPVAGDTVYVVLDGELTLTVATDDHLSHADDSGDGQSSTSSTLQPGDSVSLPWKTTRAVENRSEADATLLVIVQPGGSTHDTSLPRYDELPERTPRRAPRLARLR